MNKHNTREQWLEAATESVLYIFAAHNYTVPKVRVSCGWPHAGGTRKGKRTIGQCWAGEASSDGVVQIFISPYLDLPCAETGVLATLIHELCHAVVGNKESHNKIFGKCARAVGLEGKLTATSASELLLKEFEILLQKLGDYPHAKLDLLKSPVKKQTTRMHKAECGKGGKGGCGYTVRVAKKWLDEVGAPHCPKHGAMVVEEPEPTDEGEDENE